MKKIFTKYLLFTGKILVLTFFVYYVINNIEYGEFIRYFKNVNIKYFVIALLFFLTALFFNVYKWRYIVLKNAKVSNYEIISSIFGGYTFSLITPGRLGEMGRFLFIRDIDYREVISFTVVDKSFNITINSLLGLIVFILFPINYPIYVKLLLITITLIFFFLLNVYIFAPRYLYSILIKLKFLRKGKTKNYLKILKKSDKKSNFQIFILSLLTYIFFLFEFIFLSMSLKLDTFFIALKGFMVSLFLKTMIPISIAEWGVKEISLMEYYKIEGVSSEIALGTAFILYILNIILPSLVGLFFILKKGGNDG